MNEFTKISDTTWKVDVISDGDVFETEIGDEKQVDFFPQIKIKRWDNECNFSMRRVEDPAEGIAILTEVDGKIEAKKEDIEDSFIEKTGGFDYATILKIKPKTNVLEYTLETKGLDFFFQPPLTPQEIEDGSERPQNVEGSYAVYHSTKSNHVIGQTNYKTGKAFHIYRPSAIDNVGTKVYCDLDITENLLTKTIPQTFLDNAVYPVTIK